MKITRTKIIVALVIIFLVIPIIAALIYFSQQQEGSPETYIEEHAVEITVDQDTGEQILGGENAPRDAGADLGIAVFGTEQLVEMGLVYSQVTYIREILGEFAEDRLNGEYTTVTIRPQDLTYENGILHSTLRLGESDILLPLTITAMNTGETGVAIADPEGIVGGDFDSGVTNLAAD